MTATEIITRLEKAKSLSTAANPVSAAFPNQSPDMPDAYAMRREDEWVVHHLDPESESYEREIFEPLALIQDPDMSFGDYGFSVRVGNTSFFLVDAGEAERKFQSEPTFQILWRG